MTDSPNEQSQSEVTPPTVRLTCRFCFEEIAVGAVICKTCRQFQFKHAWYPRMVILLQHASIVTIVLGVYALALSTFQLTQTIKQSNKATIAVEKATNALTKAESALTNAKSALGQAVTSAIESAKAVDLANHAVSNATKSVADSSSALAFASSTMTNLDVLFLAASWDATTILQIHAMIPTNAAESNLQHAVNAKYIEIEGTVMSRMVSIKHGDLIDFPERARLDIQSALASASVVEKYNSILYCYAYNHLNNYAWQKAKRHEHIRNTWATLYRISTEDESIINRIAAYRVLLNICLEERDRTDTTVPYLVDGTRLLEAARKYFYEVEFPSSTVIKESK